ncbi:MAG: winged helix-turn-helix domain-containing protein, partial [Candidatus Heimdallarchaeota archaeon]|nr:winged helix-turn-helix domain-containing protein [Candidatus Heimdallarchaeota archaeon]
MNSKIDRSNRLPEAAIPVLKFIRDNGKLTQRSLIDGLKLPTRTVRYSIRRLLEKGLISKSANLTDMRSIYYYVP